MNAILSRRKTGAVILAILIIFLMANIIVQNINMPKADASVALAVYLVEHGLAYLALLLGIGGVVYADMSSPDFTIQNPVDAFVNFVEQFYNDYMAYDIMNFIDSFTANGSVMYNEIPQNIRKVFLDFAEYQAGAINTTGDFGYENPWSGNVVATPETGQILVENIPSNVGVGFQFTITRNEGSIFIGHATGTYPDQDGSVSDFFDRWQILYYGSNATVFTNQVEIQYYVRSNGSYGWQHMWSAPYAVTYNDETGEYSHLILVVGDNSVSIYQDVNGTVEFKENLFPQQDNVDRWTRFTGHSDVYSRITNSTVNIVSAESGTITSTDVIDDGTTWRDENAEVLEYPVIPPWVELGQETINLPVGGIEDITGEGTTVGDITTPIDTTVDYPVDYPDTITGVGDVPLDIPNTASGNWIEKLNFDWTAFANVTERFPLSIPWDIQRVFALFNHYEAEPPEITFNLSELFPNWSIGSDQEYSISFEFIEPYVEFIRWMLWILMVMAFVIFLLKHYIAG